MYSKQWMYHETLAPNGRLISSEKEEAELVEDGWCDTPAKFGKVAPVVAQHPALDYAPIEEQGMFPPDPPPVVPKLPGRRRG